MSLLDEITDSQIEFYNAKLQVMREILREAGIAVSEDTLSERAHAILDRAIAEHSYEEQREAAIPAVEPLDG